MGHWYLPNTGEPLYEVEKKSGGMRPATIRDARPLGAVPSVTTILGVLDKPGLNRWQKIQAIKAVFAWLVKGERKQWSAWDASTQRQRIKLMFRNLRSALKVVEEYFKTGEIQDDLVKELLAISNAVSKTAADDGTAIHDAIEAYFQYDRIHPQYHETVNAVLEMLREKCGPQQWEAEKWFASPLGYGGKIDLISPEWVIDFKTKPGNAEDHKMYDEQLMQLVAYDMGTEISFCSERRLANIIVSRDIPGSVAWWSWDDADGLPRLADEQRAWETFHAALTIWKNQNRYWPENQ